ncbi:MAG: glycosyltransferase family 39 protein [Candidatus Promineifilaceae bacterium]|nr:glycosyltransferase family 39 protein [Candidatus Promineifilaceae bacterium]
MTNMVQQERSIRQRSASHWPFLILLAGYLLTAAWLSFWLPPFTTPNEALHYEHAALLRRNGRLPDPLQSERMDERHQPPLYYALVAAGGLPFVKVPLDTELEENPYFFKTIRGNRQPFLHTTPAAVPLLYVGRLVSTLLGALAITAIYSATVLSLGSEVGLLVAALMAFQPMFLFLSASLNNDLAVTALITLVLAYTTFLIVTEKRPIAYLLWGVLFALAVLTKANALFLAITLGVACVAVWQRSGRLLRAVQSAVFAAAGFLPLYGAWLISNISRGLDAIGVADSLPVMVVLQNHPANWLLLRSYLFTLWRSFFLDWSSGEAGYAANWVYIVWLVALIIAAAGWLRSRREPSINSFLFWMHLLWILPLIWMFISVKSLMVMNHGFLVPEGRWVIPALPSLAWLVGVGWVRWWPAGSRAKAALSASAVPVLSTLLLLMVMIPAMYPRPKRLANIEQVPGAAQDIGIVFNHEIKLAAAEVSSFTQGRLQKITFYWQALADIDHEYAVSTELIIPQIDRWEKVAGVETYPGLGLAPTKGWHKDEIYRDEVYLRTDRERYGPASAFLRVRLLDSENVLPATDEALISETSDGSPLIVYPAQAGQPPLEAMLDTAVNYGGFFDLIAVSAGTAEGGVSVTLWWQAKVQSDRAYTIFVHLLDDQEEVVAQSDAMPDAGRSPTTLWQPGDIIRDDHWLPAPSMSGGSLLIGAYHLETLERLPITKEGSELPDRLYRVELE